MLEINPVYYDVPQAHLMAAIDAQLEQLDKAGAIISCSVDARIREYRTRLDDLKQRLHVAKKKIESIAESKEGIVIYSAGSYPVPIEKQKENFKRLVPLGPLQPSKTFEEVHRPPSYVTKLEEGMRFLHVKPPTSEKVEEVFKLPPKGLGSFRKRGIRSVVDILLFNSATNPYSENPPTPERSPSPVKEEPEAANAMGSSLSLPPNLTEDGEDGLFYDPGMGSTPELLLPSDLPLQGGFVTDLPDLQPFGGTFSPSSQSFSQSSSSLFPSSDFVSKAPIPNEIDNLPKLPDLFDSSPSKPQTIAPPPPPPAPSVAPPPPVPNVAPPPPPPPIASQTSPAPPPPPPAAPSPSGDRGSLLDAIRNHRGVSSLKSAKRESKKTSPKKAATSAAPVDHMEALKQRLQRIGEISTGPRPKVPEPVPVPQQPRSVLEAVMAKIESKDVIGSDSDEPKDDSEWD